METKPNQMMTCPYDKSHQIENYKFHIHLQKCRKHYKNGNKVSCPFDSTHIVNDMELDHHVMVCPKADMLERELYVLDDYYRPIVEVTTSRSTVECSEDWDDEVTKSYTPDPSKNPHIIRKVKGATPSERRAHRMASIKTYIPKDRPKID